MTKITTAAILAIVAISLVACGGGSDESPLEKEMRQSAQEFGDALTRQERVTEELKGRRCGSDTSWEKKNRAELVQEAEELKPGAICHLHRLEETRAGLKSLLRE